MSKHSGKIGLYLLLIVALIAGYLYLNDQVSTQGSYTMGQLEKALEEDKVTDAVIHQNREVPTGYVTANIVSDGQKTVYVTDVKEAEALLEEHDIDPTIRGSFWWLSSIPITDASGMIRVTFGKTLSTLPGLKNPSGKPGPSLS